MKLKVNQIQLRERDVAVPQQETLQVVNPR